MLKRQQSDVTATRPAVKAIFACRQAASNTYILVIATIEAPMFNAKAINKVSLTHETQRRNMLVDTASICKGHKVNNLDRSSSIF